MNEKFSCVQKQLTLTIDEPLLEIFIDKEKMSKQSKRFPLEMVFPSSEIDIYFETKEDLKLRDLVATIQCYDAQGGEIQELKSLAYSEGLKRYFTYLRAYRKSTEKWIKVHLNVDRPISRVVVEVLPWRKDPSFEIDNVLNSVFAAVTTSSVGEGNPINFLATWGRHEA